MIQASTDVRIAGCDPCNLFLIRFYGMHLRLLLLSFSLQPSLLSPSSETQLRTDAILSSHATALDMLKLVSSASVSPLLYFAQDSVHVMLAYAAVFLIKVSSRRRGWDVAVLNRTPSMMHLADLISVVPAPPLCTQTYSSRAGDPYTRDDS
jgi:hypothetical protein